MATFGDLVEEVKANLRGYTRDQEMSTYLTAGIDADDLTLAVADATVLSRGRAEIDDELISLESVTRATNAVTIPPYGRGSDGTTAAPHSLNAKVTFQPLFPRHRVKQAINDTIRQVDGILYSVASTTLLSNAAVVTYELPADVDGIVSVEWDSGTATLVWTPIRRYRLNKMADTTAWPTGVTLDVLENIPPGLDIRVTYRKSLTTLSATGDNFTATGLLERAKDVVVYGAMMRLASTIDVSNLTTLAVERAAFEGYGKQQIGDGTNLTKFYFTLFQQRLLEEQAHLNETYPIRAYHTR